jgi:DNA polymerase-3 subunit delta'
VTSERDAEAATAGALPWAELLPWHAATAAALLSRRERFPQALLIHGPRGIGKHALALALAQGLLCEAPSGDGLACGRCPGCRYAVAGRHPDLLRLELVMTNEETGELEAVETITIDRVRTLIEAVQLSSHRQRAKVGVVAPAERMNAAAANALLKTLEEPPPGTYFVLVSDQPGRLPATIVSRCRRLQAPRPTRDEAITWLEAQGIADAALVLAQAEAAPLAALVHADPRVQEERRLWIASLAAPERLSVTGLGARIDAAKKDERRARLGWVIDWLLAWTADLALVAAGSPPRRNPDAAAALATLAPRLAPPALFRYHRSLLRQRALLAHPLAPRLVVEALLIDYRDLFG